MPIEREEMQELVKSYREPVCLNLGSHSALDGTGRLAGSEKLWVEKHNLHYSWKSENLLAESNGWKAGRKS